MYFFALRSRRAYFALNSVKCSTGWYPVVPSTFCVLSSSSDDPDALDAARLARRIATLRSENRALRLRVLAAVARRLEEGAEGPPPR
eukprot:CAMPEP_0174892100 /NCGR_PEP_ID=MMETSP0167-20121228/7122_1 /TAXON_ID=38298 /ORGANISM="Rhodella maculata, Strain CCMP736" /LENGTH=86 /DNA_ID=CAMNT_0016130497 /DNA_START=190 /DNA_END=450 /DNA_ORIENTATION=-